MSELYEFLVEWPSATAQSVIVTGDFDKWSQSLSLSRSAKDTFTTTIKVPYGRPTQYKFIVDGEWVVQPDQPTEFSPEGYLNNIHYVPLKASPEIGHSAGRTQDMSLDITCLKDTIVASAGTSGALAYVTSGIGETVRSVVGVDPFNSSQIAIPTPITPSTSIGFPPLNESGDARKSVISASASVVSSPGSTPIEPVYATESHTTEPSEAIGNEEDTGTLVGVRPVLKNHVQVVSKEEGMDTEASQEDPTSPPSNTFFSVAGPSTGAKEAAKVEILDEQDEESALVRTTVPITEVDFPLSTAPIIVAASEPISNEPAFSSREPVKDEMAAPAPNSSRTPEKPSEFMATQDLSFASTRVQPPSRPTTPSGTAAPTESATSTPSFVRRPKIFQLGKKSPSRVSTMDGRTDEFGVQDERIVGKKKRKSSIFMSLKKLFHHELRETDKGENPQSSLV